VGRLIEDFILQGGVGTEFIKWQPFDGVGRVTRNGLNFTERGFGVRGAVGIPDRGHTAASQLKPGDFDWDHLFGRLGVRWLHTGGIFAALSDITSRLVIEAVQAAKQHGTMVSYDLNYRPSLWKTTGGLPRAQAVNGETAKYVAGMSGTGGDSPACLGFAVAGADEHLSKIDLAAFKQMIEQAVRAYPNFKVAATTLRAVRSATRNDWGAICWAGGNFFEAPNRENLEILDRVGGGDSFASGLIYGFLKYNDPQKAVEYGAAHGALAMTTPGDTSMASLKEVESLVQGGSARVQR
jgi:2-dehydro-3-deoxygluconokinase